MTVYLTNIALIFFWALFLLQSKNNKDNNKKLYCGIVAFQWVLISGFRHVDIGADTLEYKNAFERVKQTPWSTILENIFDYLFKGKEIKDPGYALVEKISQIFCKDYQVFLIFIALLFTGFMAVWIYKNSKDPCFSFFLYSILFYSFYALTGHRQTIATALIVFLGYKYIKERKFFKFTILAFIAFLIHKSSVVFFPYYFIANIPITIPYVVIATIIIGVVTFLGKGIYGPLAEILGFGEDQIDYAVGGAETYAAVLSLMCLVVLVFYFYYKNRTENATRIFNITLLTLLSSLLVFQNQSFMRIQQYYSLFLCISLPEVIYSFEKKSRIIVYVFVVCFLVLYLIRNNPQYLFFWQ